MQEPGSPVQVAEGIYQVRLPLPFALRIVNCYLLDNGDGSWSVIDTGLNRPEAQEIWRGAFQTLGIAPAQLSQIILTHVHPDHYGMAGWLQELSGAPVRLSQVEADIAQGLWVGGDEQYAVFNAQMERVGAPPTVIEQVTKGVAFTRAMTYPHPQQTDLIAPGDGLTMGGRSFTALHAPGHSDGQLIFYDASDQLLLSGDHVLMKITPNIGLWPNGAPEPLARFLTSLHDLHPLAVRLALPGHRALIEDWPGRIDQLLQHHAARLDRALTAVGDGATAYEVARQIFDFERLTPHEIRFAVVETLAHLEYLVNDGALNQSNDPVWWYRKTG